MDSQTEDILGRLIRGADFEIPEKGLAFLQCSLESEIRDFPGCGVDTAVIVLVDFLAKDVLGLSDIGYIISYTGANQSVMNPLVRALYFTLGLSRQGIGNLDIAIS